MSQKVKKQVVVTVTSMLITGKKTEEELEYEISSIWYLVTFKNLTKALLDLESEINVINSVFVFQLDFKLLKINMRVQKIDNTILEIYEMVVFTFFLWNKDDKEKFFEENFLLADVKPDIVLRMPFLTMSNADIDFQA